MNFGLVALCLFIGCFLLGSIPWGVIISRVFYHTDVRQHGSGNIGTTNALRAMGKVGGAAVFILDFAKGLLAGLAAYAVCQWLSSQGTASIETFQVLYAFSLLGCVWGHIFSPWLGFKGGKGIAVAIGNLFVTFGIVPSIVLLAIFAVLVAATRKVSIGSIAAAVACPIVALYVFWGNWLAWGIVLVAACTVIWAHRSNIQRLIEGSESKFSMKGSR